MTWAGVAIAGASVVSSNQAAGAASDAAGAQQDAANLSRQEQLALMQQQRQDAKPYRESGYNALNQLNYLMGLGAPTSTAHTQDYFNPEAYRDWRIQQMTDNISGQYKNPDKAARIIAKKTEMLNKMLADPGDAWADYSARAKTAPNKTSGDFWKSREGSQGQQGAGGSGTEYGFLQKRFNNAEFEKDPGYQFRMDEGNRAVEGGAAARGGLLSGAAAKAMQKYSQGFASNEYGNAYNRFTGDQQNMFNRLSGIAGTGQQQMNQTNQMQQNGLNNSNGYMMDAANARASGIVGASNARQSGYQQAGNTMMDAYQSYQQNKNNGQIATGEPNGGGSGGWSDGWATGWNK